MWPLRTSKNHMFFHTVIFRNCIPSSVYVCMWKIHVWKVSVSDKFTIKELLKLTKETTWRQSNIVLKLEKIKFTNTLNNNVQLEDEFKETKRTKQLQQKTKNKKNIEHKTACLSQLTNRSRRCRSSRKKLFFSNCGLVKVINE